MYTIKAYVDGKEYTIHDARVKALTVGGNPYFEIGDNINGSATFKVFPTHPYYDKVKKLTTDIVIYRDDEPEFYGEFSTMMKIFLEGLVFDLEPQGKYMAFAQKASASASSYTTMLCFSRANSIYDEYGVNMGCNLIGNWYTLKNFKIGSISAGGYTAFSGAIPIVCEITNNGNSWTYSHLRVYNGIIVGYWN